MWCKNTNKLGVFQIVAIGSWDLMLAENGIYPICETAERKIGFASLPIE